jgi:hypothetical protein
MHGEVGVALFLHHAYYLTRQVLRPQELLLRVDDRIRTGDRLDHNQELYQLSYVHRAGSNLAGRRGRAGLCAEALQRLALEAEGRPIVQASCAELGVEAEHRLGSS